MRGRRASASGRQRAGSVAAPPPVLPSPWQAPGDILLPVLELLLAQEEGTRWLRVASHVCSSWRSMSLEVLLADTAISKPPLEDFRAIGQLQATVQPPAMPAKADTVATQAAVVMEASASTGVEAMSKPCVEQPPTLQQPPALLGQGLPPGLAAAVQPLVRRTRAALELQQQHRLQRTQGAIAPPAAAAPAGPPQHRQQQQQQQQQQRPEAEAPQGSIQSDVAAVGRRAAYASDSEGGSTLAQVPHKRKRRRMRRRGPSRGMSVEQPLPPQQARQQQAQLEQQRQQQGQRWQEEQQQQRPSTGPPSTGGRLRKRAPSAGEVNGPLKRRHEGTAQPGDDADGEGPSRAAQAKRARRGGHPPPASPPAAAAASPASGLEHRRHKVQQRLQEGSEVSGAYAGLDGADMEVEGGPPDAVGAGDAAAAGAGQQAAMTALLQRSVGSGPVQAVFGFVRRFVGLGP